jgi:hypothetical protein
MRIRAFQEARFMITLAGFDDDFNPVIDGVKSAAYTGERLSARRRVAFPQVIAGH